MAQLTDQANLPTDAYASATPAGTGTTTDQKKMLAISAAALLLGGAAWAVVQKTKAWAEATAAAGGLPSTDTTSAAQLPADIDIADKVTDAMSFEQAFTAARQEVGMGGVFGWHGRWYNTFEKEEWDSLSLTQRQEYTELITGEKLPVKPFQVPVLMPESLAAGARSEPTVIEGYLEGRRVLGLDVDKDGIIDTLVLDGHHGHTFRVVDSTGDAGLDTLYNYDAMAGELTAVFRLDQSFVLTNDDFSQYLENRMSKQVVDSILEPDVPDLQPVAVVESELSDEAGGEAGYAAEASHADDDTYVNDGDVRDLDE